MTGVQTCALPISWYARLNKQWRDLQDYDDPEGYQCDFDNTIGYTLNPNIVSRHLEYQQQAIAYWKEAALDIIATITKRG